MNWLARFTVIGVNIAALGMIGIMFAEQGLPNESELLLVSLLTAAPFLSLLYIIFGSGRRPSGDKGGLIELVGLELEARKAVLKRRIEGHS